MAGRIRRADVEAVRERARIEDIVAEHVTLRSAGVGSMKGLCPFHDERTPSFHVRPQVGLWHCFGCDDGGDVISFVQKIDHLGFAEAVELLAERVGVELHYEDGGPRSTEDPGRRQRVLAANRVAAEFYAEQLHTPQAQAGRAFLGERGFGPSVADDFGIGYAPQGWESLLKHMRGRGFTEPELIASGLFSQGQRGIYDRFRGRLIWPIRDVTGDVVGFGARHLYEDDPGPKYLNTPETTAYKKSQVLYGIDIAKRGIARTKQIVVVEGYTDVMAAHLSGVTTAVATCGTAFGSDHARLARRLLGDSSSSQIGLQIAGTSLGGKVIFTFDGDAAGQKAALRAFGEDQRFAAQTFVAVDKDGLDPCEIRQRHGEEAVRRLIDGAVPLYEFVVKAALQEFDLNTVEGRVAAQRAAVPIVAGIRDPAVRQGYANSLAGWLGVDVEQLRRAVAQAGRSGARAGGSAPSGRHGDRPGAASDRDPGGRPGALAGSGGTVPTARRRAVSADPVSAVERQALEVILQVPRALSAADVDALPGDAFSVPAYRAVHDAIRAAGGLAALAPAGSVPAWLETVREAAAEPVARLITELAVAPLPADSEDAVGRYARGIIRSLIDVQLTRQIGETRGRLQRADAASPEYQTLFAELIALEERKRATRIEE